MEVRAVFVTVRSRGSHPVAACLIESWAMTRGMLPDGVLATVSQEVVMTEVRGGPRGPGGMRVSFKVVYCLFLSGGRWPGTGGWLWALGGLFSV